MTKRLEDIEGIGPAYGDRLRAAGIETVDALLEAGHDAGGRRELARRSGIAEKRLLKYVGAADLFRIRGVAGQYAELLAGAGVDTVKELKHRDPKVLAAMLVEVNSERQLVRQVPTLGSVVEWVEQAKGLPPKISY